jgi:hypothetical protein
MNKQYHAARILSSPGANQNKKFQNIQKVRLNKRFLGKNKNTLPQPPNTKSTLHFVTTCDRMTVLKVS